ncbi:protein SPT2 homolog [Argopecten irradians]|uniref:protein SPT2 homolog n=1 Tax=Argopecten irradians TaxID=31199 RepID=UPI00371C6AAB
MDFTKLLSIAAQKQQNAEKQLPVTKMYSTEVSAAQKKKKDEKTKSEVVKKYLEEKEAEKRRKERERRKQEEAKRKQQEEEEKSKRFRIPKIQKSTESGSPESQLDVQNKSETKSNERLTSGSSSSSGDKKSQGKTESSKSSSDKNHKKSDPIDKSVKTSSNQQKHPSSHKDNSHKVFSSNEKSHSSSGSTSHSKDSSRDKHSSKESSREKLSSKDSSKDSSKEKSSSKDSSREKSSSKDSSREKSSSKDISRDKSSSKEKSSSKDSSREKSSSKDSSKEKSSSRDISKVKSDSKENSQNGKSSSNSENPKNGSGVGKGEHIPEFSNREMEATRWTSKLTAEEQLRIRVEFERKKARLKESLNKDKDSRIRISEGKQPVFKKAPPDEAKKKAKAETEAQRRQRKIEERRLKNEQEIERIMQSENKDDKLKQKPVKHSKENSDKPKEKFKHRPINLNKNKPPPKLNFQDILKLAQEKAQDPVEAVVIKKPEPVKEHRPMTQEEKDRQERKKSKEYKDWYKYGQNKSASKPGISEQSRSDSPKTERPERKVDSSRHTDSLKSDRTSIPSKKSTMGGIPERKSVVNKTPSNDRVKQNGHIPKASPTVKNATSTKNRDSHEMSRKRQSLDIFSEKDTLNLSKKRHSLPDAVKSSSQGKSNPTGAKSNGLNKSMDSRVDKQMKGGSSRPDKHNASSGDISKKRKLEASSASAKTPHSEYKKAKTSESRYDSTNENVLVCRPSGSKVKRERSPPPPAASNPWDRIYNQVKKDNPKPVKKKKQVIEDDSDDLDEDLDGFIDDDDGFIDDDMDMDYSKHIKEIFGYDKSKYRYESDYEISNMESNFREQMKEEARSARLGLQEDLEDMRKEEEELRLKALAKKKNAKRR